MKAITTLFCLILTVTALSQAAVTKGDAAPELSAEKWYNTSSPVTLEETDGIVVVEFWATWCPPCRKSIPHLVELHEKYNDMGVTIIGLTNEKPGDKLESFIDSMEMVYIVGAGSSNAEQYGVRGIPTAFIVDPDGTVAWRGHPMSGMDEALEKLVAEHTEEMSETTPPAEEKTPAQTDKPKKKGAHAAETKEKTAAAAETKASGAGCSSCSSD